MAAARRHPRTRRLRGLALAGRYALLLGALGTVLSLLDVQRGISESWYLLVASAVVLGAGGLASWRVRTGLTAAEQADLADLRDAGEPIWPYGVEQTGRGLELRTSLTTTVIFAVITTVLAGLIWLAFADQDGRSAWVLAVFFGLLAVLIGTISVLTAGVRFRVDGVGVHRRTWPRTTASWPAVTAIEAGQQTVRTAGPNVRVRGVAITAPGGISRRGRPSRAKRMSVQATTLEASLADIKTVLDFCWSQARSPGR